MPIQMKPVESTNIEAIGFEPGPPAIMQIQFVGGGLYQYTAQNDAVVKSHYEAMMLAESKGRHFAHVRKDKQLITKRVS